MVVIKHFNHDQTVANQPNLFDFDPAKDKYLTIIIFTIFDRFDRNYGSVFVFVQPKFFGSFLFQNRCSTDVKKDAGPSKLK